MLLFFLSGAGLVLAEKTLEVSEAVREATALLLEMVLVLVAAAAEIIQIGLAQEQQAVCILERGGLRRELSDC